MLHKTISLFAMLIILLFGVFGSTYARTLHISNQDWMENANPHPDSQNIGSWAYVTSNRSNPEQENAVLHFLEWDGEKYVSHQKDEEDDKPFIYRSALRPGPVDTPHSYIMRRYTPEKILSEGILVRVQGHFQRKPAEDNGADVYVFVNGKQKYREVISKKGGRVHFAFLTKGKPGSSIDFVVGPNGAKEVLASTSLQVTIQQEIEMSYQLGNIVKDWRKNQNPHISRNGYGEWAYYSSSSENPALAETELTLLEWNEEHHAYQNAEDRKHGPAFLDKPNYGSVISPGVQASSQPYAVQSFTSSISGLVRIQGLVETLQKPERDEEYPVFIYVDGKKEFAEVLQIDHPKIPVDITTRLEKGSRVDFVIGGYQVPQNEINMEEDIRYGRNFINLEGVIALDSYLDIANTLNDYGIRFEMHDHEKYDYDPASHRSGFWQYFAACQPQLCTENAQKKLLAWNRQQKKFTLDGLAVDRKEDDGFEHALPYTVKRWTSGINGSMMIKGLFNPVRKDNDGVPIYIYHNEEPLIEKVIYDLYAFMETVEIKAGDTIDFVVGPEKAAGRTRTQIVATIDFAEPRFLGTLSPFWRSTWDGSGTRDPYMQIPAYLTKESLDFPVPKRPYEKEVPFADHLTVVRPLSAFSGHAIERFGDSRDIVYEKDGELFYRWELLRERMDIAVQYGYDGHNFILDNVPNYFPEELVIEHFGQAAPPAEDRYDEWYDFISKVGAKLKEWYPDVSKTFRFRIGTELEQKARFAGSIEQLKRHYDYTVHAIKSVFPDAKISMYNETGIPRLRKTTNENSIFKSMAKHSAEGVNYKTKQIGSPVDIWPISYYYARRLSPDERSLKADWFWDEVVATAPDTYYDVTREVHEYGVLADIDGMRGVNYTGAFGGALHAQTLINWLSIGVNRGWMWWQTRIEDLGEAALLCSDGWVYTVMHRMVGDKVYKIPVMNSSKYESRYKAIYSLNAEKNESMILLSSHNPDPSFTKKEEIIIHLPKSLLPEGKEYDIGYLELNRASAVYNIIYDDLKENNLLNPDYDKPHKPTDLVRPSFRQNQDFMGKGLAARDFVLENIEHYKSIIADSLTLKEWRGSLTQTDLDWKINFEVETPAVLVLVIEWK